MVLPGVSCAKGSSAHQPLSCGITAGAGSFPRALRSHHLKVGVYMKKLLSVLLCLILLLALPAAAHSGRTDSNGGHTDHSTGEYHYHHGYPAHQHPSGVCPYDHSSKKTESSGQTSASSGEVVASGKHGRLVRISDTPERGVGYRIHKKETTAEQPGTTNSTVSSGKKGRLVRISDTPELEIGYIIRDAKKKETTTQQTSPDVQNKKNDQAVHSCNIPDVSFSWSPVNIAFAASLFFVDIPISLRVVLSSRRKKITGVGVSLREWGNAIFRFWVAFLLLGAFLYALVRLFNFWFA